MFLLLIQQLGPWALLVPWSLLLQLRVSGMRVGTSGGDDPLLTLLLLGDKFNLEERGSERSVHAW